MSALYKLKAYFGMVPADELDDFDPEYDDDYELERHYPASRRATPAATGRGRYDYRDDYRDYDEDDQVEADPPVPARAHGVRRAGWASEPTVRGALAMDTAPAAAAPEPVVRSVPAAEEEGYPLSRIVTLHPRNYNEARPVGERYREGTPVIMNLTEMDDADAKRLVDFAAGLAFAMRGSIDKVTNKVFLISPPNVDVTAEDKRRIAEGGFFNQS